MNIARSNGAFRMVLTDTSAFGSGSIFSDRDVIGDGICWSSRIFDGRLYINNISQFIIKLNDNKFSHYLFKENKAKNNRTEGKTGGN